MILDFEQIMKEMIGKSVPKPVSGTLSGHAAGEPFDKLVYQVIKEKYPNNTYRQYEYLNDLYSKNPTTITKEDRLELFNSPSVMFLLNRGNDATSKWTIDNLFDEKQNDTADIIIVEKGIYDLIDVKTRQITKKAQAPNIISAYKLAQLCTKLIDNNEFNILSINYIEIDWLLKDNSLLCTECHYADIFKSNPSELYINWAAAMQIQFHVSDLCQNYSKDKHSWAKEYLRHFVESARHRSQLMIEKYVIPFEKYIN
jgi:hypothetical protein